MTLCEEEDYGGTWPNSLMIITNIILAFVVIGNSIGIYLLKSLKNRKTNQMIIMMSLSCVDILLAILWFCNEIIVFAGCFCCDINYVTWSFRAGIYLVWYAMIFLITLDRLLGCNFPIKHKVFIRTNFIYACLVVSCIIAILFIVIVLIVNKISLRVFVDRFVWSVIDFCFLALFIATYASIFLYLKRQRKSTVSNSQDKDHHKFIYTVAGLITAFLFFEIIPSLVKLFHRNESKILDKTRTILYSLNLLCDPILYVFLQPAVREHGYTLFRRIFARLESPCVTSLEEQELAAARL